MIFSGAGARPSVSRASVPRSPSGLKMPRNRLMNSGTAHSGSPVIRLRCERAQALPKRPVRRPVGPDRARADRLEKGPARAQTNPYLPRGRRRPTRAPRPGRRRGRRGGGRRTVLAVGGARSGVPAGLRRKPGPHRRRDARRRPGPPCCDPATGPARPAVATVIGRRLPPPHHHTPGFTAGHRAALTALDGSPTPAAPG